MIRLQRRLWLAAFLCASGGSLLAADVPRGRPIEFSEPRSERTNSNVQSLMPGRTTMLDQLEADINRPFKSIMPGNSLNGLIMPDPGPAPQPIISSAKAREIINNQNDKKYLTTEERYAPKSLEDKYKFPELTPDGRDLKSLSASDRQMMRALNGDRSKLMTNQMNGVGGPGFGNPQNGFANPDGVNATTYGAMNPQDSNLRKILGMDAEASANRAREQQDARDLFGLGNNINTSQKLTPADLRRRDSYMQMYNNNYVAPVDGVSPVAGAFSTPYVDSSFYDPPKPLAPAAAAAISASSFSAATVARPYTPNYVAPPAPVQPAVRPEPVSPFMNVPKRVF